MKKYYEFDKDLIYRIFIDYKQVYDCINKDDLQKVIINFGILKKDIDIIKLCNNKTVLKVNFLEELTSEFEVNSGLRQKNALSPTIFILCH